MSKAIQIRNLTKRYRNKAVVEGLNLSIQEGELFALLGVNGAGKTTTIKIISGLIPPTGGDAELLGDSVVEKPYRVKEKIGVSPQETAVARNLTVRENLRLMCGIHGDGAAEAREKAEAMLEEFGMAEVADSKAQTLSGGWQRRLSIAMALITKPKILFLDEPTLGLDVLARRELWRVIQSLKGSVTIVLTTHYLEEAAALADQIGIMAKGRLLAAGTAAQLMEATRTVSLEEAFLTFCEGGEAS